MVTAEEIEKVAKLMRIEMDDHAEYIERVKKMLGYFDLLDKANVESEEIDFTIMPIENLRKDEFIPYDEKLIEKLKNYKGTYVRAPKMV
ncbi:MAG: aspartyl/glutamyl-tRNA amidotransferase subunit C [Crenarchaeota archaeon]|nr:MAG: aspartyl/glutamyl-tRNA amidotransferase subunit C [Thermoproteota archaeon]RDJ34176.1 MAG: aspartyl/glutamyl-tRNA amidotransferase subunit C [Thermoproteota archaeon]RDJ36709.1 MAG: aspartyl/glutamyl-tRNA amidotransferase subunit C [Thermoproteota archaeon]RDJ37758.1 MAG: aspartyl/glutamyl-tRNA amidotransferase subunit C [Thermoproteota archaeon]